MQINRYKIRVDFEVAVMEGSRSVDKLASDLNMLFHETVKNWAKDHQALATPTRTTTEGDIRDAD